MRYFSKMGLRWSQLNTKHSRRSETVGKALGTRSDRIFEDPTGLGFISAKNNMRSYTCSIRLN